MTFKAFVDLRHVKLGYPMKVLGWRSLDVALWGGRFLTFMTLNYQSRPFLSRTQKLFPMTFKAFVDLKHVKLGYPMKVLGWRSLDVVLWGGRFLTFIKWQYSPFLNQL